MDSWLRSKSTKASDCTSRLHFLYLPGRLGPKLFRGRPATDAICVVVQVSGDTYSGFRTMTHLNEANMDTAHSHLLRLIRLTCVIPGPCNRKSELFTWNDKRAFMVYLILLWSSVNIVLNLLLIAEATLVSLYTCIHVYIVYMLHVHFTCIFWS